MIGTGKSLRRALLVVALTVAAGFCCLVYSGGLSFAKDECGPLPQARGTITQNPDPETSAIDAEIAAIDSEIAEKIQQFARQEAEINRDKSEALKELTAQLNKLNADRLKLAGKILEQAAIDAQLKIVQQKIDRIAGPLDDQLKAVGRQRKAQLEALNERRAALVARRESLKPPCLPGSTK